MNKIILTLGIGLTILSYTAQAQKSKITDAKKALNAASEVIQSDENKAAEKMQEAQSAISDALNNDATKNSGEAWLLKARIFLTMQTMESFQYESPYKEGAEAIAKAIELDPKIAKNKDLPQLQATAGYGYFFDGTRDFDDQKYTSAIEKFTGSLNFWGETTNAAFKDFSWVDTLRSNAKLYRALAYYYAENDAKAATELELIKNDKYNSPENSINAYIILASCYDKLKKRNEQLATIEEGRKKFPADANLLNAEINYYIDVNEPEKIVSKLEEAISREPSNPQYPFNLGLVYTQMANPEKGEKPANAEELEKKAETQFNKAVSMAGDNPTYISLLGIHYFNQGVDLNKRADKLGSSAADNKLYNQLIDKRDNLFKSALPFLEKSANLFESKSLRKMSGEEKNTYYNTLDGLARIYAVNGEVEKAKSSREKRDAIK